MLKQWIVEDLTELMDEFLEDRYAIFTKKETMDIGNGKTLVTYPMLRLLGQLADNYQSYMDAKEAGLDENQDLWADDPSVQKKMGDSHLNRCDCCRPQAQSVEESKN